MYDEKLKGYEEFEDICDVRSFECAQEGRNMDITVEDDDIKSCNNFDNIDCIDIEKASYSKGSCNNHAEFIISSFKKCNEEESCDDQCKCNDKCKCKDQCKCKEEPYIEQCKCNKEKHYIEQHKCNEEEPYINQNRCNEEVPYINQNMCNENQNRRNEEEYYVEQNRFNEDESYINQFKYNVEEKCQDNCNYNYDYDYNYNSQNCLQNNECKQKKQNKKQRNRSYMSYKKGVQVGYRIGYMKAQQDLRRKIMYMYNMFQCR